MLVNSSVSVLFGFIVVPSWNTCVALHCWGTVSVMFQFSAVMSPMLVVLRV